MIVPGSTYRLQVTADFGFDDAAGVVGYLADLGVTHAYLSPILQAAPGSMHGYDVVDHTALSAEAGGEAAFRRLSAALHRAGMGAVADVVPNHMAIPVPESLNAPLWQVLRDGPDCDLARWFDVDWGPERDGRLLMPVLGGPIGDVLADGDLRLDRTGGPAGEPVLRYYQHVFPVRPGTEHLQLPDLVDAQWYRLAWWRVGSQELNYRRFFDVTSLIAVRVEDPEVFDASHALLLRLVRDGDLDGLRIDHPDGLTDPRGYLRRLAAATGSQTWVVVEKILEGTEVLPADWPCAGTTGYDALNQIQGLFVDPDAEGTLTRLAEPGDGDRIELDILEAKLEVLDAVLRPEVDRLVRLLVRICAADLQLRDHTRHSLTLALSQLLLAMDRYRAYAVPGEPVPAATRRVLDAAVARAADLGALGEQELGALHAVRALALDTMSDDPVRLEFLVRFQQTCGPVMAKGIEDTLFYRDTRLLALNEVGADPHAFGVAVEDYHEFARRLSEHWPATMTTLSTHDTKRSEDARARLLAVTEVSGDWAAAVAEWEELAERHLDGGWPPYDTRSMLWQTLVAVWGPDGPPSLDRVLEYLVKAGREAKTWTAWTAPSEEFEEAVESLARGVLADLDLVASIGAFVERTAGADRVVVLGQKLVQLTMPGVPDVYQGCELVDRSLVDPDNRRPVDYARRRSLLALLDAGTAPAELDAADRLDAEKLLVTSRALRLRRDRSEVFAGAYLPLDAGSAKAVAFGRGGTGAPDEVLAITVATRLSAGLKGPPEGTLRLPAGDWTEALTGRTSSMDVALPDLLATYPVALLTREP